MLISTLVFYRRMVTEVIGLMQRSGLTNNRNVYWSHYEPRNFGDWVTPYLYKKLTGLKPLFCQPDLSRRAVTVFGAGSILRHLRSPNKAIIWGSGIISAEDEFAKPRKILAVRGALTRERCLELGVECPEIYGDPAVLLPMVYPYVSA